MTFSEFTYQRPDLDEITDNINQIIQAFKRASNASQQVDMIHRFDSIRSSVETLSTLAGIRHSLDTNEPFYTDENAFYDKAMPAFTAVVNNFYKAVLTSRYLEELKIQLGQHYFNLAELRLKSFEPTVIEEMQSINSLATDYQKLKAKARIEFDGAIYNLSSIIPLEQVSDRTKRKAAAQAKWSFLDSISNDMEGIYDKMVHLRHGMATKLGYENYIGLGYDRMKRSDYSAKDVASFREQIKKFVVPIATELHERKRKRLGLESICYYDESFHFNTGNPTPKGSPDDLVEQAGKMYKNLSNETDQFFNYMREKELMDLVARDGKQTGGYCAYIPREKSPFIFSNFNGTSHDITVLTHEAGHAFQCYSSSADVKINDYIWPTFEACEIHSMSMEFFTLPWMSLFFKEDTDKFMYHHMTSTLTFLPYGCAVDEFQHIMYENPNLSIEERNKVWLDMEKKYLPHKNHDGQPFLERGGFWQRQSHIFSTPFYYIDYVLAQICAYQFWHKSQIDQSAAWKEYVDLCKRGGSLSFIDLVDSANLISPFAEGCVEKAVAPIKKWLSNVDDRSF